MPEWTDDAARADVETNRLRLCLDQPFFGCLALQLILKEMPDPKGDITTMAVDGKHLFYHPPFVHSLSEKECIGVLAHEVMHCAFKHFSRRGMRNPRLWNVAGDFVINAELKKSGFILPGVPLGVDAQPGTKGHLYEPKFEDLSTEEVYERLMQKPKFVKFYCEGDGGGNDPGGCGGVVDTKGSSADGKKRAGGMPGGMTQTDQDALDKDWDTNLRLAVNQARAAGAGNVPGCIERLVKELDKPIINWRDLLWDWIDSRFSSDYSFSRPNRRSTGGMIFPGLVPDSMAKLVCVFDCSGSIGEDLMKVYGGEAGGALHAGVCDTMVVIYTDTIVQKVDEFTRYDELKIKTPGGGGTDFKAVMKYIAEEHSDAGAIIFLTDMCTNSFGDDPQIPVLWGATIPESQLKNYTPPFGQVIHVTGAGQ